MKKIAHLVAAVLVIAVLCWALWRGVTHREKAEAEASEAASAAGAETEPEPQEFVVSLKKEKWESLRLEVAEPEKHELVPTRAAYGRVLDPSALVALDG